MKVGTRRILSQHNQKKTDVLQELSRQMMIPLFIIGLACSMLIYEKLSKEKTIDNQSINSNGIKNLNTRPTKFNINNMNIELSCTTDDGSECNVEIQDNIGR